MGETLLKWTQLPPWVLQKEGLMKQTYMHSSWVCQVLSHSRQTPGWGGALLSLRQHCRQFRLLLQQSSRASLLTWPRAAWVLHQRWHQSDSHCHQNLICISSGTGYRRTLLRWIRWLVLVLPKEVLMTHPSNVFSWISQGSCTSRQIREWVVGLPSSKRPRWQCRQL